MILILHAYLETTMSDATNSCITTQSSLAEVKELLRHHLHAIQSDSSFADKIPPLMLWGPPGVGKSAAIMQITKELGIGFIDIRLAQREPVDIRGLPIPKEDGVHWMISSDWPRKSDSRGVILFDELTAADRTLQVAAYEFILDRRLGDLYTVPAGWYICAAGNRSGDRAVSTAMSSALANRFCHVEVMPDIEVWVNWAIRNDIHPDVIAFLRFRPECFICMDGNLERGWPSPRSWERVSTEIHISKYTKLCTDSLRVLIHGLVGPGAGTEFLAFREWSEKLPNIEAMMLGYEKIEIPDRADLRYSLCAAMVYTLWHGKETDNLLTGFFKISQKLTSDFAAMSMMDALMGDNEQDTISRSTRIVSHPEFRSWTKTHGKCFKSRFSKSALYGIVL